MNLDNGIIIETLQNELILLVAKATRIAEDLLKEINSLTEMVGAGKEVLTPTTETLMETFLTLRKAIENTLLKATQPFDHDPSTPITLVIRTKITDKTQISTPMNRSSPNILIEYHPTSFALQQQMITIKELTEIHQLDC